MRPELAVTEFLYAHEYAEKSHRWYAGMLGRFTSFCAEQGITTASGLPRGDRDVDGRLAGRVIGLGEAEERIGLAGGMELDERQALQLRRAALAVPVSARVTAEHFGPALTNNAEA